MIIFSLISSYTSFFTYYATLTGTVIDPAPIFLPFEKLGEGNMPAIASAFIALIVDGLILLLGTVVKPYSYRASKDIKVAESKPKALTEIYLQSILEDSNKASKVISIVGIAYCLMQTTLGLEIQYGILLLLFSIVIISYIRVLLLMYRIRKGTYGNNYYEAKEIISFISEGSDDSDPPFGGGRNAFPKRSLGKNPLVDRGLEGGATPWT